MQNECEFNLMMRAWLYYYLANKRESGTKYK